MRLPERSTAIRWHDTRLSLTLFACATGTLLAAQIVAVGLVGPLLPWIVAVTSLPWAPLPGQVAQTAAVFALVAIACAPLERHGRWQRTKRVTYARRCEFDGTPCAIPRHTRRHTRVASAAIAIAAVAVTGGAVSMFVAGSVRTQPSIVRDALRSEEKGDLALAFETMVPAASGPYDRRKFEIYFLVSGWALDLHDWPLAARLSLDLMRAAAAEQDPRSLVAGLSQYELAAQRVIPAASATAVVMSASSGHWRTAVRLLIDAATHGTDSRLDAAVIAAGNSLPLSVRTRFLEAVNLLQRDMSIGVVRP